MLPEFLFQLLLFSSHAFLHGDRLPNCCSALLVKLIQGYSFACQLFLCEVLFADDLLEGLLCLSDLFDVPLLPLKETSCSQLLAFFTINTALFVLSCLKQQFVQVLSDLLVKQLVFWQNLLTFLHHQPQHEGAAVLGCPIGFGKWTSLWAGSIGFSRITYSRIWQNCLHWLSRFCQTGIFGIFRCHLSSYRIWIGLICCRGSVSPKK